MSRYQNVHTKMWVSADFRALSGPKPNARDLWIHLLTGTHSTALPGLFRAGPATLAEELGWAVAAWLKCWAEVQARGMAIGDWAARVLWIPRAIEHRPPQSVNVIKSWRALSDEIPDCPLKAQALTSIGLSIDAWDTSPKRAFTAAFRYAFPEAIGKPSVLPTVSLPEGIPVDMPYPVAVAVAVPVDPAPSPGARAPDLTARTLAALREHPPFAAIADDDGANAVAYAASTTGGNAVRFLEKGLAEGAQEVLKRSRSGSLTEEDLLGVAQRWVRNVKPPTEPRRSAARPPVPDESDLDDLTPEQIAAGGT